MTNVREQLHHVKLDRQEGCADGGRGEEEGGLHVLRVPWAETYYYGLHNTCTSRFLELHYFICPPRNVCVCVCQFPGRSFVADQQDARIAITIVGETTSQ